MQTRKPPGARPRGWQSSRQSYDFGDGPLNIINLNQEVSTSILSCRCSLYERGLHDVVGDGVDDHLHGVDRCLEPLGQVLVDDESWMRRESILSLVTLTRSIASSRAQPRQPRRDGGLVGARLLVESLS